MDQANHIPAYQGPDVDPAVALDQCRRLREALEAHYRAGSGGYSAQRDAEYRRLRREFVDLLGRTPGLKQLKDGTHVFPPTLASECDELHAYMWGFAKRQDVVRFEGRILTAMECAGVAPFGGPDAPERSGLADHAAPATPAPSQPNRAQRRAEQRQARAYQLRDHGLTIKEIARELRCSERTVYSYLEDLH